jgi:hypothetical protein
MTVLSHLSHVPFPDHIQTQEHMSQWARVHFENHVTRTTHWKQGKGKAAGLKVVMQALGAKDWKDHSWNVNQVTGTQKMTISTRHLVSKLEVATTHKETHERVSEPEAVPYCLDAEEQIKEGHLVGVSPCYPSPLPDKNRDPRQQWTWAIDSTIRPYTNQTLCLTADRTYGPTRVGLRICDQRAEQHWSYDGHAPGNPGGGGIYFAASAIGVVAEGI